MAAKKTSKKPAKSPQKFAKAPSAAVVVSATKKKATKKTESAAAPARSRKAGATSAVRTTPAAATVAAGPSLLGKRAPAFKLLDQDGKSVSSTALAKKAYVLYFYPKDNTPGCTVEACDFRDATANFRASGVTILGVSPDSPKSHAGFASKYELPFTLLSDPDKELAQAYGVWALKKNYGKEYWGIVRSTFLIGADGKVKAEWRGV